MTDEPKENAAAPETRYVMHVSPEQARAMAEKKADHERFAAIAAAEKLSRLRDEMAMAALGPVVSLIGIPTDAPDEIWNRGLAAQAYGIADAMLEARAK